MNLSFAIFATFSVSAILTGALVYILRRRAVFDHPNERSLHQIPTPRGGGWAILLTFGMAGLAMNPEAAQANLPLIGATVLLAFISWLDDRMTLPALPRFGAQIVAVGIGLTGLHGAVFQGWLPPWLDYALAALAWLWFVNLFNFMDGMDGLAGGEAFFIALGLWVLTHNPETALLAAAVFGFLLWNWSPAKLFMGDVGSIPLGYILAAWLLKLAEQGHWVEALLFPLYFLVDATVTLLKRLLRRERVWQAHRQHFYQYAAQTGRIHGQVAGAIMFANAALLADALMVTNHSQIAALALGIGIVGLLISWLRYSKALS